MLKDQGFPEPGAETLIIFCGPKPFNDTLSEMLEEAGYDEDQLCRM